MARMITVEVPVLGWMINRLACLIERHKPLFVENARKHKIPLDIQYSGWMAERIEDYCRSGLDCDTYLSQLAADLKQV